MTASAKQAGAAAIVAHRGVTVRIYALPDRKRTAWRLAYYVGSRRRNRSARGSLEDARKKAREIASGIGAGDIIDALHLTPLDRRVYITAKEAAAKVGRPVDALCREAAEAAALAPGVSPRALAEFWRAHHATALPSVSVSVAVAELLAFLRGNKKRAPVTVATLRGILDPFAAAFPCPIGELSSAQLETWLGRFQHAPRTLNNYRAALIRLFNFCRGRYLPKNQPTAADAIEAVSEERGPVAIFRPWELASILTHAPVELLPCIALGAFAGVRNCELCRVEWSAVRFTETSGGFPHGFVEVAKAAAKQHRTAARRIIPISANLARWLDPYQFRAGPICPYRQESTLSGALTELIAGINAREARARRREIGRPANGLRHSFGSYRLPVLKSAAALAIEMNNSEAEVWRDYHELAPPRDVETWWQIAPVDMPLFAAATAK